MKREDLLKRKEELAQQKEMALAQLQQIIGAIAMLDELLNKPEEVSDRSDKAELKKAA